MESFAYERRGEVRPTHCPHTAPSMQGANPQALFNVCLPGKSEGGGGSTANLFSVRLLSLCLSFRGSEVHWEMLDSQFFERVLAFDEVAVTFSLVKPQILMGLEDSRQLC